MKAFSLQYFYRADDDVDDDGDVESKNLNAHDLFDITLARNVTSLKRHNDDNDVCNIDRMQREKLIV